MPEGIVDVFEAIQIEKEHGKGPPLTASERNGLRYAVAQQQAIGEISDKIMLRGVGHLQRHGARRADVVENNHCADNAAGAIVDRGRRIFNCRFESVAADEDAIESQTHGPILLDSHLHWVSSGLARGTVNNLEDFGE